MPVEFANWPGPVQPVRLWQAAARPPDAVIFARRIYPYFHHLRVSQRHMKNCLEKFFWWHVAASGPQPKK